MATNDDKLQHFIFLTIVPFACDNSNLKRPFYVHFFPRGLKNSAIFDATVQPPLSTLCKKTSVLTHDGFRKSNWVFTEIVLASTPSTQWAAVTTWWCIIIAFSNALHCTAVLSLWYPCFGEAHLMRVHFCDMHWMLHYWWR